MSYERLLAYDLGLNRFGAKIGRWVAVSTAVVTSTLGVTLAIMNKPVAAVSQASATAIALREAVRTRRAVTRLERHRQRTRQRHDFHEQESFELAKKFRLAGCAVDNPETLSTRQYRAVGLSANGMFGGTLKSVNTVAAVFATQAITVATATSLPWLATLPAALSVFLAHSARKERSQMPPPEAAGLAGEKNFNDMHPLSLQKAFFSSAYQLATFKPDGRMIEGARGLETPADRTQVPRPPNSTLH